MFAKSRFEMEFYRGLIQTASGIVIGTSLLFLGIHFSNSPKPEDTRASAASLDAERIWLELERERFLRNTERERVALSAERQRLAVERERISWKKERDKHERERMVWERERFTWEREHKALRQQSAEHREALDALKRNIDERRRERDDRPRLAATQPPPLPEPQPVHVPTARPKPAVLYYRVAKPPIKQIEYDRLEEMKHLLQSTHLAYRAERPYKDFGLGPQWVPLTVFRSSWQELAFESAAERDDARSRLAVFGVETSETKLNVCKTYFAP